MTRPWSMIRIRLHSRTMSAISWGVSSIVTLAGRIQPVHPAPPAARLEDAGQRLDGRRLAGPVRADVADHLAGRDAERDAGHGLDVDGLAADQPEQAAGVTAVYPERLAH